MREYRKRLRANAKPIKQAIMAAVTGAVSDQQGLQRSAAVALGLLLDEQGLPLTAALAKLREKLQANRLFNGVELRDGKTERVTMTAEDNDAQLRATEAVIGLHERAGTIPAATQGPGGAGGLHYHLHLDSLAGQTPPDVVDVSPDNVSQHKLGP